MLAARFVRIAVVGAASLLAAGATAPTPAPSSAPARPWAFEIRPRAGLPGAGATFGGTFADVNGDGRWDLVLSRHGRHAEVYLGREHSNFEGPAAITHPDGLVDHHGTAACDVDGDGDWDFFLSTGAHRGEGASCKQLWLGDGALGFVAANKCDDLLADPIGRGRGALWWRVDPRETRPQLLLTNYDSPARFFGPDDGTWVDRAAWFEGDGPGVIHVAETDDLDGDGRLDLLAHGDRLRLWSNSARSDDDAPRLHAVLPFEDPGETSDIATGDVDGDGDVDVLLGLRGGALRLLRNESRPDSFAFAPPLSYPDLPAIDEPVSLALADLDNDGVLDLVVAQRADEGPRAPVLARGRGDGTFTDAARLRALPSEAMALWALDLDRDGDLDLVTLNGRDETTRGRGSAVVFENRTPARGITVELVARPGSVPHGLGARVTLRTRHGERHQLVRAHANPWNSTVLPLHFGVGDDEGPVDLLVEWPRGARQQVHLPRTGAAYRIHEDRADGAPEVLAP